jgi:phospholipid transport system substrate-binding protein
MATMKRIGWGLGCLVLLAGLAGTTVAQEEVTAHDVVKQTTGQVMSVVSEAPVYVEEDPERYYQQIQSILDPVIDFRGFARSVMGPYASSKRYRSLDTAGREQLAGQLDQFTEIIREGLVRTYSKGLLAFGGSRIVVNEPQSGDAVQSTVSVEQLIYSEQSEPYIVMYQMGRDRDGQWKLRNMIIESVNLGEIYRSQFQSSARKYDGDLDQVIKHWAAEDMEEPATS